MRTLPIIAVLSSILTFQIHAAHCLAQSSPKPPGNTQTQVKRESTEQVNPANPEKYAGRYVVEVGLSPISTIDVTLADGELWAKPSLIKKRKLIRKSELTYLDSIEGTGYIFITGEDGKVLGLTFEFQGSSYNAQKIALPAPSLKGNTTFKLSGHPDARVVVLTGSFNNWDQSQLIFGREAGEWVCRIDLAPGKYTYTFILDGEWLIDPSNPKTEKDEAGNIVSVLEKER